jgi:glycosyltransferase involved in cell wall biosynthesis
MQAKPPPVDAASQPLVSVIIPTFNRAWCLKEAIDSVLAQTYTHYELIVVDDGSTDKTKELLYQYKGINAIYQENQGVSAARNKGIAASKGELVAFLDSDDLWKPEKLATQIAYFGQHHDAMICQTEEIWIRNGRRIFPKKKHKKESGYFFERSLELCLVSPSAVMIKRQLFNDVGLFDEKLTACEDYDLWLRVGAHLPIYLIDEALIIKRGGHADQLSSNPGLDKYRVLSIQNLLAEGSLSLEQENAAINMLQHKCQIFATGCQKRGKIEEMQYYLELATKFSDTANQGALGKFLNHPV